MKMVTCHDGFCYGFPKFHKGFDTIWVLVNRLTKYVHFLPTRNNSSLEKLTEIYIKEIVQLHGIQVSIISDHDPQSTSKFWRSLYEVLGTRLYFSTTFHPQIDGQSVRTMKILEHMLRACIMDFGGNLKNQLHLIEFSYNNSYQSSIQMAPNE